MLDSPEYYLQHSYNLEKLHLCVWLLAFVEHSRVRLSSNTLE